MEIKVLLSTSNKSKVTFQSEEIRERLVPARYGSDERTITVPIASLNLTREDWIDAGRPTELCIVLGDYNLK